MIAANLPEPIIDRRAIPAVARETTWMARDGWVIRRIDWPPCEGTRGSLLFMPGRGDAYEKYLETLHYWHMRGWRVTSADWRGQAGSGRLGQDPWTGHIDDFSTWASDLAELWEGWKQEGTGPHVLAGHSMGGHLVLRALAESRVDPDAVILNAPMLGLATVGLPDCLLHGAARLMAAIGDPGRPAWRTGEKPGSLPRDRMALLTHDQDRYGDEMWWRQVRPEIAMGSPSWGWVERAYASMRALARPGVLERIGTPAFIAASNADRLVSFRAIERAARRLPCCEFMVAGSDGRHELLREVDAVRDPLLARINTFLQRNAPQRS